ncbi:ALDH-like protein [Aaosphaeria arxii CBS 175.79]|uniref:ALDH-like protein n=1 Tax=Aaosphaeria arxii CBS 175.79 TaxID=1450172 RepID=A0A6A5Y6N4_9PLEO|nr:ALDH-like protein [Aaosphaeria arxii CBS 175.79]KAF2020224.1 ALDH-like protein [Aaosphaeria arxii CBS 175.79]
MPLPAGSTVPLWINGRAVSDDQAATFPVVQSSTSTTVHQAQSASPAQAIAAVESSWTAFKTWKKASHTTRRDLILRVAAYYEANVQAFVDHQVNETSCTEAWARQNVDLATRYLREIAACISSVTGVIPQIEKPNTMGFVFKEPVGPVLCIAPWNAALILATRGIASAIAAGCTVVFKASELSPRTHFAITEAFTSSGVPEGVLNQIQVRREDAAKVTEEVIAHEAIRKVEFIGSAAVGRIVAQVCAKYLKPILMELGGKCPAIVLDDADLDEAAKLCALGAVLHHGQICFSTERIIVHEAVADRFKELLITAIKGLDGPAGSAVTKEIAQHAEDVLNNSKANGDEILVGGAGYHKPMSLKPTIVVNPSKESRIVDEETFGPSASLYVVQDDAAAIALANRSAYGLNATIWSRNMERALNMSRELEYGQVHINSISVYTSPTASQGGVKGSGFGRQNARWGLEEFVVDKFVSWHGR